MHAIFFGSPDFAVPSLLALLESGVEVPLVVSQPAKPAGRKAALTDPPVAQKARELGLPVFQPQTLKDDTAFETLAALHPDFLVVVAYGKILGRRYLDLPSIAPVNVHGSLLPRWRGASPVQASLLAGDADTGVSLMRMEAGMDTGPVYSVCRTPIQPEETHIELSARLARLGAELLVSSLPGISSGELRAVPQVDEAATYCPKIQREDGQVSWGVPALEIERRSRAFHPWPGLFAFRQGNRVKLIGVRTLRAIPPGRPPGEVLEAGHDLVIACGGDAISVERLQREGKKELSAMDFVRGERVVPGEIWE